MAFLSGGLSADSLVGTAGQDTLAGYHDSDRLDPGAGADRAVGGPGADFLYWDENRGSSGVVDTYIGGDWRDHYDSNIYGDLSGGDRLILGSRAGSGGFDVVFTHSEGGRALDAYGNRVNFHGIERIQTGSGNDSINGTHADIRAERYSDDPNSYVPEHGLTVMAGGGNDTVRGSNGVDVLDGGDGNDRLYGNGGTDLLMASAGDDWVHGGTGDDNIRWGNNGGTGPIYDIGDDTLIGGNGSDLLNLWGKGNGENSIGTVVTLTGSGSGYATFARDNGTATFSEFEQFWTHEGRDTVTAANADIALNGRGIMFNTRWGDDVLTGSRGIDTLEGGDGADTINGGQGNDHISMFESFWVSDGGSVAPDGYRDILVLQDGSGVDTVRAFEIGRGASSDRLNVSGMHDAQGNRVDVNDVRVGNHNGDAVLIFPNGERVIFEGVNSESLTRSALIDMGIPVAGASQAAMQNAAPATAMAAAAPAQADSAAVELSADRDAADQTYVSVDAASAEPEHVGFTMVDGLVARFAASALEMVVDLEHHTQGLVDSFDFSWG